MRSVLKGLWLFAAMLIGPQLLLAGPVNVNTADEETLAKELVGIGPALAAAIVRDREENGPYKSPEEITRVRGVGERVLENNRENIKVNDEESASK
jgi:competence protein ComEA